MNRGNKWVGISPTNKTALGVGVHAPGTHNTPDSSSYVFDTEAEAIAHINRLIDRQVKMLQAEINELNRYRP